MFADFIPLRTICDITKGVQFNKRDMNESGTYPVINGGMKPTGYIEQYNQEAETITVAQGGAAGYVSWQNKRFWAGAHCYVLLPSDEVVARYLYHVLKSKELEIQKQKYGTTIMALPKTALEELLIPVPPILVQREIVRILDKWSEANTGLIALLMRELELRNKQYQYYFNKLMTFEGVEWIALEDLFDTSNGYTPSKSCAEYWENGSISWFRLDDIRANGRILSQSIQRVTPDAVKGELFPANSIIITTSATIGEHALITSDFIANQRFTCLTLKPEYREKYSMMFLFYYCFELGRYCRANTHKGSFESVDMCKFRKFRFPVISLEEQHRIASILDRFNTLCTSLTEGLPAEIQARKKQYAYYRDKLLTFSPSS